MNPRTCGDCRECCTVLGIAELKKPPGARCQHLSRALTGAGCSRYPTRPKACQEYLCVWRAGSGDDDTRPDKVGVMLTHADNTSEACRGINNLLPYSYIAHECWAGAVAVPETRDLLIDYASLGVLVLVIKWGWWDELGRVFGPKDVVHAADRWCQDNNHPNLMGILQRADPD